MSEKVIQCEECGTEHAPDAPCDTAREASIAFKAGQDAKRMGVPLRQSALRKIRPGTQQYEDFIDGYESLKRKRKS
jgi:hypothetical protein